LRRGLTQDSFVVETVQSGCLSRLKIDAGLATQRRGHDDPFRVVIRLKQDAQCFARSRVEIS